MDHFSHITLTLRRNAILKQMTVNSRYIGKPDVLTKFTLERQDEYVCVRVCVCVRCVAKAQVVVRKCRGGDGLVGTGSLALSLSRLPPLARSRALGIRLSSVVSRCLSVEVRGCCMSAATHLTSFCMIKGNIESVNYLKRVAYSFCRVELT